MIGAGIDEINEASSAVEFGEEEGGVGLGLGGFDPLKTRPDGAAFTAAFAKNSASITADTHGVMDG